MTGLRPRILSVVSCLAVTLAATLLPAESSASEAPVLAIIIDDLGHRYREGLRVVELPGAVTCSVLPMTPYGRQLAGRAHKNDKEVLLHLPMAAEPGHEDIPGGIELDTTQAAMQEIVDQNLEWLPYAAGVNNHRGSLLTRHPGHMEWLMTILAQRNLFFVDSRTTPHTVALQIAEEHGVDATRRDVFLDNERDRQEIDRALMAAVEKAKKTGTAVAIGHPYPQTLDVLEARLPEIEALGVRLGTVEEVIRLRVLNRRPQDSPGSEAASK